MNHYVYEITNLINEKRYIGKRSCKCPIEEDRYMGSGKLIKQAIRKYGIENFTKKILKICGNEQEAYESEKIEIDKVKAWNNPLYYNLMGGGLGAGCGESNLFYGRKHSEETKIKISRTNKGKFVCKLNPFYGRTHTKEVREKFIGSNNPMFGRVGELNPFYGKTHTEETIQKIIEANKGRHISDETREKLRVASRGENNHFYGKNHSEESKRKISDSMSGEKSTHSKRVAMLSKDGEVLIETFGSAREASRWLCKKGGHANISLVCNGERKTAYGYVWKYLDDSILSEGEF